MSNPSHSHCCDGFTGKVGGTLEYPRYSPGLILEDSDLTAAVDYTRNLNRLLFRTLFGCGVVCGLTVSVDTECDFTLKVEPGFALDPCGNPIEVVKPVRVVLAKGKKEDLGDKTEFWVLLHNREKHCATRKLACDDEDGEMSQTTRTRLCAEVCVTFEAPKCACMKDKEIDWKKRREEWTHEQPAGAAPAKADGGGEYRPEPVDPNCPASCDCGCGCGGDSILLAYVYKNGEKWIEKHSVRRFVRPLLAPDPVT